MELITVLKLKLLSTILPFFRFWYSSTSLPRPRPVSRASNIREEGGTGGHRTDADTLRWTFTLDGARAIGACAGHRARTVRFDAAQTVDALDPHAAARARVFGPRGHGLWAASQTRGEGAGGLEG
jgi:hypothetical protein